jgi:TRAP-type transport system periplasmic protein
MTRATPTRLAPIALTFALVVGACASDDTTTTDQDPDEAGTEEVDQPAGEDEDSDEDIGPEVTLTFGHPFPGTDPIQVNVWEPWIEEVREQSNGTIDIEIHPGGALAPPPAMYENVVAGAQDLAWTMPGYTPGRFPITQVIEAPFVFENATAGTEVAWQLWEEFPEFQDEYSDVHLLAIWAMDTGDLFTRDRRVETLEDLSGLTIRAPSPMQAAGLEAMGASPVTMPGPELYDAVERGVIDGYKLANSATRVFDLGATTSFRVDCHCYTGAFVLVLGQQAWDGLSARQQEILTSLSGPDLALRLAAEHDAMADEVANQYWPEHNVETTTLDDAEFQRWREAVQPVFDQWVTDREADGVPGQAMADRLFELNGN